MNVTTRALHLADAAVALAKISTTRADEIKLYDEALTVIREARAEQSIVLNDPHPPHRLCECTACLEYWTPLPDCDAFAGGGKPIDHIADTGKMVAEPVKQEPVAWWNGKETAWFEHELCGWQAPDGCTIPLYTAPVDAKAIRAEAISGVACRVKALFDERGYDPTLEEELVTAIRGLK